MSEPELQTYVRKCRSCGFLDEVVDPAPFTPWGEPPLYTCAACGRAEADEDRLSHGFAEGDYEDETDE